MSEPLTLAFVGRRLLVAGGDDDVRLPDPAALAMSARAATTATDLGPWRGAPTQALDLPQDGDLPHGTRLLSLRQLHGRLPQATWRLAGRALHLVEWRRTSRFCGRCGAATELHPEHRALACPECGQLHFPRVAPAIITLVERDGEMLLGRSAHFPQGVYSTLAGFVDPGESAEEALHREVMEEAGVRVDDVRYFGSQPWPFPHSLMLGYVARWVEGEIDLADGELEDARWFSVDELPPGIPPPMSIARRLIDDFLRRNGHPEPESIGGAAPAEDL